MSLGGLRSILGLGLLCFAWPASANPSGTVQKLAVLPIIIPAAQDVTISSIYADVADAASLRLGIRLITNEEMFVASSGNLSDSVQNCGSDVACMAQRLQAFDAPLGLVVVVNKKLDPPLIGLQLIDTDARRMMGKALGELEKGETVSSAVRKRARKVFEDAGFKQAGRVVVDARPPNAKIILSSGTEPDLGTPNIFTLVPGRYEVKAELDGYAGAQGEVVALSGQEAKLVLVLDKQTALTESVWFWGVIGAAVVAGGATAAVIATRNGNRCVCLTIDHMGCSCPP